MCPENPHNNPLESQTKNDETQKHILYHIIDLLPLRIFWKDMNLCYLGCNQAFANDAGMNSPKDLIGKDDYAMGWKDQADLYRKDDMEVIKSKKQRLQFEEPQTTPDGKKIWLLTSKVPLTDSDQNVIGILGTYEDITEKKNADLRVQSILRDSKKFQTATIGRELAMIKLKKEINQLSKELGRPEPYDVSFENE